MKPAASGRFVYFATALAFLVSIASGLSHAADVKLPVIHGKKAVASVNGEPIALDEYARQFASIHEGATGNEQVSKKDPGELLERMVRIALVVQEAENIGLDDLPEFKAAIGSFQEDTLKNLLFQDRLRTVVKADPKEIDKVYKNLVKEVKIASILLDTEEDAKSLVSLIKETGDFPGSVDKYIGQGKGKGSSSASFLKADELSPDVARLISGMKPGDVSPIIRIGNKFTIIKVEAFRFPDNPEKRKEAGKQALNLKRDAELRKYVKSLEKKYVKYDDKLMKTLDFEAEASGFATLLKDERPLVRIQGEKPVTVKDLAEALQKIYFHGIEQAIQQKRVNTKKQQALEQIVVKRIVHKEAMRRKFDRSPSFTERAREFRKELLFGIFVQKVIDPENRVSDDELKSFMKEHIAEYTVPEQILVDLLVFANKGDAEEAIVKLRNGADFQWLRSNASGQVDPSRVKDLMDLSGKILPRSEMPGVIGQAIAGAGEGDFRLQADPDGNFLVIAVRHVDPPRPEEFEKVKDRLAVRVFNQKRVKALEGWMDKLKEASKVEIYVQGPQLRKLLETRAW